MRKQRVYSRSFLISLTGSLLLHLVVLFIILLPSNHDSRVTEAEENPEPLQSQDFTPSLLINYSEVRLQKSLTTLTDFIKTVPNSKRSWRKNNFLNSFQETLRQQDVSVTSVTLHQGKLEEKVFSIKTIVTTDSTKLLHDCLLTAYLTGVATKKSNFRSDHLILVLSNEEGTIINTRVSTDDCRLFSAKKMNAHHFVQKITIF
ncbi:hypothetical protein ACFL27_08130 [candidate division CSSED10-310 bacterium]|uniref:Uncharacterized protein n=1 Tax=candidate division CSSED10-310 bacterium TaxID=2855610 RepID=A0ABV6YVD9_UNCC1